MNNKRIARHALFWSAWVFGFTFIKSFGRPVDIYFGWFVYYIVTLPLFVIHTYLIVFWMIPAYFQKRKYLIFTIFFLIFFCIFSMVELLTSHEFVYRYFPVGLEVSERYFTAGNIIINGLGNFYIIMVFLAARSIRTWYLNQESEKEKFRHLLALQVNRTIAMVHPGLLIYAVNSIEKLAGKSPERATRAIAIISEILNEIIIYNSECYQLIEKEVGLIQKFVNLVKIFRNKKPEVEFFLSGDPAGIKFPPLVLFSLVEILFRQSDKAEIPELNIEISDFSNMATVQVLFDRSGKMGNQLNECEALIKYIEQIYPDLIKISFEHTPYGCSIVIKATEEPVSNNHKLVREHI